MNSVEIEEAITALAEQPFDGGEFMRAYITEDNTGQEPKRSEA